MKVPKTKIQYWFTWVSLGVFILAGFGLMVLSWNGMVRGPASPTAMILLWASMSAAGIYLFLLAVKKAHRLMVTEDRRKIQEDQEKQKGISEGRRPKKDKESIDPVATARKLLRRIPDDTGLDELGKELMPRLAQELEIMSGVYYVRRKGKFHPMASYALASSEEPFVFAPGEGLSGQVASNRHIRVLTELPEGHRQVYSGLGKASPSYLAIVPLLKQEECVALFECSGYKYDASEIESTLRIFSRDLSTKLFEGS